MVWNLEDLNVKNKQTKNLPKQIDLIRYVLCTTIKGIDFYCNLKHVFLAQLYNLCLILMLLLLEGLISEMSR
jgi:hypothetical protein